MAIREVHDGPYARYLRDAMRRCGGAWEPILHLPSPQADAWLRRIGVPPFEESVEGVRLREARKHGGGDALVRAVRVLKDRQSDGVVGERPAKVWPDSDGERREP